MTPASTTAPIRLAATPIRAVVVAWGDGSGASAIPGGLIVVVPVVAGLASAGDQCERALEMVALVFGVGEEEGTCN